MGVRLAAERRPGTRVSTWWCKQDLLDLERMRTVDKEKVWDDREGWVEGMDTET